MLKNYQIRQFQTALLLSKGMFSQNRWETSHPRTSARTRWATSPPQSICRTTGATIIALRSQRGGQSFPNISFLYNKTKVICANSKFELKNVHP